MEITLEDLNIGDRAQILGFKPGNTFFEKKLIALGLIPHTEIQIIRKAPLGGALELQTLYSSICVRIKEASAILRLKKVNTPVNTPINILKADDF